MSTSTVEFDPLALRVSTSLDKRHVSLAGGVVGIHWPELDEDISIESLLRLS